MEALILSNAACALKKVKRQNPLVHQITNYITANDCANITLAIGASPVMADAPEEVEEIVARAQALVLNLGVLNPRTVDAMLSAGLKAKKLGVPVVLDPVGVGASSLRKETAKSMIKHIQPEVIRGNLSEIKVITGLDASTKGVDVSQEDMELAKDLRYVGEIAKKLSSRIQCVVAVTGMVDILSDGKKTIGIKNGHTMLTSITGTGCMCSALIGSLCSVTKDYFVAAASGVLVMGIAAEKTAEKLVGTDCGSGSFKTGLIDSVYTLTGMDIQKRGKVNMNVISI